MTTEALEELVRLGKLASQEYWQAANSYNMSVQDWDFAMAAANARPALEALLSEYKDTKERLARAEKVTHKVKIEERFLDRIMSGQKRFEIRKDDRDYQVGDWMHLESPSGGRSIAVKIIYKSTYEQKDGFCVLGFTVGEEK